MLTDTVHTPSPTDARGLVTGEREGGHGIETLNVGRLQK